MRGIVAAGHPETAGAAVAVLARGRQRRRCGAGRHVRGLRRRAGSGFARRRRFPRRSARARDGSPDAPSSTTSSSRHRSGAVRGAKSISAASSPTSARRSRTSTSAWARSPRRAWSRGCSRRIATSAACRSAGIVEPAIGLARRGVPVSAVQAYIAAGGARDRRGRSGDARAVRQPRAAGRTDRRGRASAPAGPGRRARDPRHRGRGPVLSRRDGAAADARLRKRAAASCRPNDLRDYRVERRRPLEVRAASARVSSSIRRRRWAASSSPSAWLLWQALGHARRTASAAASTSPGWSR